MLITLVSIFARIMVKENSEYGFKNIFYLEVLLNFSGVLSIYMDLDKKRIAGKRKNRCSNGADHS